MKNAGLFYPELSGQQISVNLAESEGVFAAEKEIFGKGDFIGHTGFQSL